ncbi:MAG: NADPH-dependent oxidoreductase, partial [Muribaculaceae bacterium]|nr:NADPH-dependent oxidoreductase [Muribaculaceae bacterium]
IAENEGLGTCYLGTTTYNAPMIADVLQLPELVVPVITVALGWPAGESEKSDRLPVESFVHNETYKIPASEDIDRYYYEKENREDSKRFVAENGKETLAQVFTDVRYTREASEHFSEVFMDFLRRAKFL